MDLPEDKKQAVMNSSMEKKWQMIKDMEKRRPEVPPKEYLGKFKSVMEEENLKVCTVQVYKCCLAVLRILHLLYDHGSGS